VDGDSHGDDAALLRTEFFIRHYHLRAIGYVCFTLMVALIVAGFAVGRTGLAIGGAAMIIIGVALLEERRMQRAFGERYA